MLHRAGAGGAIVPAPGAGKPENGRAAKLDSERKRHEFGGWIGRFAKIRAFPDAGIRLKPHILPSPPPITS
jgi:hypothetical protein